MPPQTPDWPPAEWYRRLRDRDPQAWTLLYNKCKSLCHSMLRGWPASELEPDDVAQHVFKEVWEHLDEWDHVQSFSAFVQQRAQWRCKSQMQKALTERHRRVQDRSLSADADERTPLLERLAAPDVIVQSFEQAPEHIEPTKAPVYSALQSCIQQLKPVDQRILALWMQGAQHSEIAPLLIPPRSTNSVQVRFHRMVKNYLPRCLRNNGISETEIIRIWGWKGLAT
ncbi:RNA polymerase sigma factor [Candidatus Viridilinea mediisalina]|uniref:Uncharacterized protein n=1 Tax=Candidatus Viridilinea mediisalina TaxID=2024553 RepID=A0A2A6REU9_9CHLR|nr:sigma-70 family RNA polymerase sigma factor [Candidatus Viridilinea mediisalina]PDW01354.1 hypothetical protein CJ255_19315 [Candidatus Viridilinea mediisalina]